MALVGSLAPAAVEAPPATAEAAPGAAIVATEAVVRVVHKYLFVCTHFYLYTLIALYMVDFFPGLMMSNNMWRCFLGP